MAKDRYYIKKSLIIGFISASIILLSLVFKVNRIPIFHELFYIIFLSIPDRIYAKLPNYFLGIFAIFIHLTLYAALITQVIYWVIKIIKKLFNNKP